jgi:hypothetical protein
MPRLSWQINEDHLYVDKSDEFKMNALETCYTSIESLQRCYVYTNMFREITSLYEKYVNMIKDLFNSNKYKIWKNT